jgi:hypothetical protein
LRLRAPSRARTSWVMPTRSMKLTWIRMGRLTVLAAEGASMPWWGLVKSSRMPQEPASHEPGG